MKYYPQKCLSNNFTAGQNFEMGVKTWFGRPQKGERVWNSDIILPAGRGGKNPLNSSKVLYGRPLSQ